MKTMSFLLGVDFAIFAIAPQALGQNYPWCSNFHDGGGTNCGFSSYQQCMATAQGSGGTCTKNNVYLPSAGPSPARRPKAQAGR
jgi:uncharacterized protein DUF3551